MRFLIYLVLVLLVSACDDIVTDNDSGEFVDVYISAEKLQCDTTSGYSISETEALLTDVGIEVDDSFCGAITGLAFPAVCGGGTADINIHTIASDDLADAENAGFADVASLETDSTGYVVSSSCD